MLLTAPLWNWNIFTVGIYNYAVGAFNRTTLELKFLKVFEAVLPYQPFNRTTLELKYGNTRDSLNEVAF